MNIFKTADLKPDTSFTDQLILDKNFILLGANTPVTQTLINELKTWNFSEVRSEGTLTDGTEETKEEKEETQDETKKLATDKSAISAFNDSLKKANEQAESESNEEARMKLTENTYNEYTTYIASLYRRYATNKDFDREQLEEVVKELCMFIKGNRRYVLRINPASLTVDKDFLINHSMRSTVIAITIGLRMHMPFTQLVELGISCLLHEIGMLRLPPQLYITDKKLQPQERAKLASHPLLGFTLLKDAGFPLVIQRAVLEHHERENGSGYPQKLTSESISSFAKIISVACAFEAISAPRHFRGAHSAYDAMLEMLRNSNQQYDEKVIKALLYSISFYPIGVYVYLANGKIAQIADTNGDDPKHPIAQLLGEKAADGNLKTVTIDEGTNKIVRVLNHQEVAEVLESLSKMSSAS